MISKYWGLVFGVITLIVLLLLLLKGVIWIFT